MSLLTKREILVAPDTDPRPGVRLLVNFVLRVEDNGTKDPVMLDLAARLERIVHGESAESALDLKRPRGRKPAALTARGMDRQMMMAAHVAFRMEKHRETKTMAASVVAELVSTSRANVLRAYAAYPSGCEETRFRLFYLRKADAPSTEPRE